MKKHIIRVTEVKTYEYEVVSEQDDFDAMDHAMIFMSNLELLGTLVSNNVSWDHEEVSNDQAS